MFISIIVCTHNRRRKLQETLNNLASAKIPAGLEWEVIIIDNGSEDGTFEICKPFVENKALFFRYIFESKKGKSFALNRGLCEAKGDVFAFTDDDCIVSSSWLMEIARAYSDDPGLAVLGGRVELYDKNDLAITVTSVNERIELSSDVSMFFKPLIIGANMSFRKDVYRAVGGFDVLMGPGSMAGAIAEDMDYVYMAHKKGFKVAYFPSIVVYHNHGRKDNEDFHNIMFRYNVGRGAFYFKHLFYDREILRQFYGDLVWILRESIRGILKGILPRYPFKVFQALAAGAISRLKRPSQALR